MVVLLTNTYSTLLQYALGFKIKEHRRKITEWIFRVKEIWPGQGRIGLALISFFCLFHPLILNQHYKHVTFQDVEYKKDSECLLQLHIFTLLLYYAYECCTCMYMNALCVYSAHKVHKKSNGSPEPGVTVGCEWTWEWRELKLGLKKATSVQNHWSTSPTPLYCILMNGSACLFLSGDYSSQPSGN